ncbi:MAG: hypothetical protein FJW44_07985 [Actinobacteria bacterium]|nr:hypothetical protein [Actinomycetota bacterium]
MSIASSACGGDSGKGEGTDGPKDAVAQALIGSPDLDDPSVAAEVENQSTVTDEKKECLVDEFDAIGQGTVLEGFIAFKSGDNSNEGAAKITAAMISCSGLEGFG